MARLKKRTRSRADLEPVLCIHCGTPTTHELDQCDDCVQRAANSPSRYNRCPQAAHTNRPIESASAIEVASPGTDPFSSKDEEELRFGLDNDTGGDYSDDDIISSGRRFHRQEAQVLVPAYSALKNNALTKPDRPNMTRLKLRHTTVEECQQDNPTLPEDESVASATCARETDQDLTAAAESASDVPPAPTSTPPWVDTSQTKQREQLLKSIMAEDHCKIQELKTANADLVGESAKLRSSVDASRLENEQLSRQLTDLKTQVQGLQAGLQSWRNRSIETQQTIETLQAQLQKYHDAADTIGAIKWGCKRE